MVKKISKKLSVAILAIVFAASLVFGAIALSTVKADAESASASLLNLSKGHSDAAGSGFSGGNTIMIHWADGSQSGSTWGGLNLKCGETPLGDLIVLTTAEKSQTVTAWNNEDCITRVITYGEMMGINLEKSGLTKAQVVSVTLKAGLAPITNAGGWGNDGATEGSADMTKALPEDITLWLNADGNVQTYQPITNLLNFENSVEGATPNSFAGPLLSIFWKNANQPASWGGAIAKVGSGVLGDYIVITTKDGESKTVTEWGNAITRIVTYGGETGINFEGSIKKDNVKSITLKKGFAPLVKGSNSDNWGGNNIAYDTNSSLALGTDVTIYPNLGNKKWEFETTELSVKKNPDTASYNVGDSFDCTGMTLTAKTAVMGTLEIAVTNDMCDYDFSTAGEKAVTVTYANKTVTYNVEVLATNKIPESVAYKSGSVSIEQNGSFGEMTLNDLKVAVTYSNGDVEDKAVTADMITVNPANIGTVKGTVLYTEGMKKFSCEIDVTVTERTTAFTAENIYPIPLDGYYAGEDGGDKKVNDGGISIWFTTNAGYGEEKAYSGLGEKWYSDNEEIHGIVKAHVLINGKTFDELNAEGAGLARYLIGWYGDGNLCLRIHTDGSFKYDSVKTITLLKGFQLYSQNFAPLGVPTPCDYTIELADKPGTSDKMFVRKTESVEIATAPAKTEYFVGDEFDKGSMAIKAVYTDGGYAIIPVKDRMISYDFSAANDESPVTVTYNGKTAAVNVKVTERPATLTSIAVKDGAKLFLKQYSLAKTLTPDAKLVLTYSNNTTEEAALKAEMISGYTNETVGAGKATVTYIELTCEIDYTVSAYDETSTLKGISYGREQTTAQQGGVSIELDRTDNDNLKALWCIDKAASAVIGKTNGDFVTINGETVTSLVASGKVARMWVYGKLLGFHIDDENFMATVKGGAEICILPGFAWSLNSGDAWGASDKYGEYSIIENAVVTKPMYFCFKDGKCAKVIDGIVLTGEPKANYYKDDVISVAGLTLEVSYKGLEKEVVALTTEMCDYDFSAAGEKVVTVTYEGKTTTFNVTVEEVKLTGIRIDTDPSKTNYDFGIDNELDLTNLVVKAIYGNGTEEIIDNSSLKFEGFDSRKFGTETIAVKYGEFSATFEINVLDISKDKYLSVEYDSGAASYEATQHKSLVISFVTNGVYEDLGSFWKTDKYDYVADYMLINGKKVSDLIKEGKVTRLCTWAAQLVIHLDTCDLVPASWVDKRQNPDDENDNGMHYIEGVSKVVETVTFLPGFQWYTTIPASSAGWGDDSYDKAVALKGAVLKEKIELTNMDGYGWRRELKKDENGEVAEDALTIVSLPSKTVYKVGEALNLSGMEILAKYADGGEVTLTPNFSETEGYKRNEAGEQTITYTYNGIKLSFKVTVTDDSQEPGDSGSSDSSATGGSSENTTGGCFGSVSAGGLAVLGLAAAVICLKKKKENV